MIKGTDIRVARGGRRVLHGVDITVHEGEVLGIVGPNGCGKSTLLMTLFRSLAAESGGILLDGDNLATLSRREIASRIAVVAQDREAGLALSVRDTVTLGRLSKGTLGRYGDKEDYIIASRAMERVGLTELEERLVTELSGGELQRVLIARAIAQDTPYLFLDEPTNHLDLRHQYALLDLIGGLGATTLIVLHDLNLAARICDRVIVLKEGEVQAVGTPRDVLTPDVLEPIYQLKVTPVDHDGHLQLLFSPGDAPTPDDMTSEEVALGGDT